MKRFLFGQTVFILCFLLSTCHGQENSPSPVKNNIVGGGCDGCELMYTGMPKNISSADTSPGWYEKGQKLIVTGTIFHLDGRTPAPNVILYYWQTDNDGYYSSIDGMDERAKRHGHIRGWVKTDANGKYTIKTIRPAPYPKQTIPAHIHLSIKEPGIAREYYPDEINFDDDKLLLPYLKEHPQENRGGSGIVRILLKDSLQIAEHDIILGLNIPNYPETVKAQRESGLPIGEDQPSFTPYHAWGPDKGTQACPVCKYGRYQGIIYFVGNNANWNEVKNWLSFLEKESVKRDKYLKAYFVYGNENAYQREQRQTQLEQLGAELNIRRVALTFVPSFSDKQTEAILNRINPEAENTFVLFRHRRIVDKHNDIKPTDENFAMISASLDKTKGDYFDLPEIE